MAKKQFKAESKKLLDLMIHSIYTNREIFIRELISNSSDALDKRYYLSLTNQDARVDKKDLTIFIQPLKEQRMLVIQDTGIGMSKEELETNLGTIAKSGSLDFKQQLEENPKNIDIIGQFGVGFYSAFMVAKQVTVETRSALEDQGYTWISTGEDGYTIKKSDRTEIGTTITLELKDSTKEDNYDDFLDDYQLQQLIKKYSDYVRYPIQMNLSTSQAKEDNPEETETIITTETINSMIPLWKKRKATDEEYNDFYKNKFMDWEDPLKVIHYNTEGTLSYNALFFIPKKAPYNFYNTDYEAGVQLYSKGVFILDKAKNLIPDHFRFIRGLVDSDDISLNISREMLQQDRQMITLAKSIEKKIKSHLDKMLANQREDYEEFFSQFGLNLKYGLYQDFGAHKELLQDLILFKSSHEEKYTTLKEVVERMDEKQEFIYYACGDSIDVINKLPQMERLQEKNIEVLYFTDDVDEFAINILQSYQDKKFKSINQGDLDLDSEEEKQVKEEKQKENQPLLTAMKDSLHGKVNEVRISSRLKTHPVCLVSEEGISLEMEKVLANSPTNQGIKATKILEINPDHQIFKALQALHQEQAEKIDTYADILYNQALLIEGLSIEDPVAYANKVCELMSIKK